jgi:NAD(P)-dependent dehydrogenase (short-subunit alcohol dehydrogenase family)
VSGAFVVIGAGPGLGAAAARRFGHEGYPVGPIGPGARHEPDEVAEELWRLHTTRDQPLLVLR